MIPSKRFWRSLVRFVDKARQLPHTIANAAKERRLQYARNTKEAERLDRIRNPTKYLGK